MNLWRINELFLPFVHFLLVFFSVHESACNKMLSLILLNKILPSLKKPIFPTENCMVLVALFVLPLYTVILGLVYSPTLRR